MNSVHRIFTLLLLTASIVPAHANNLPSPTTPLYKQTLLAAGNAQCFKGGVKIQAGYDTNGNRLLDANEVKKTDYKCAAPVPTPQLNFNRIATIPACLQIEPTCNTNTTTAAEIVVATADGMTLIYTDSPKNQIGFIDITNTALPLTTGTLAMGGEPTSVTVKGGYALVVVNTSTDFINVSGDLVVIDIARKTIVRKMALGGQPDSIALSPDGRYAAIVIENERNESLGDGAPPQLPGGKLVVANLASAAVADWTLTDLSLTGLATLYPEDPEPEFVDINSNNIAVVTLQENNHIVLVDLPSAQVRHHFSAGAVDLVNVDLTDNRPALISPTEIQNQRLREPDGVSWINNDYFATANEGDLNGGSRGFTVFNIKGRVVWDSGSQLDDLAIRLGHFQDRRSDAKGNEPENIELGIYGKDRYLFVNSERSSLIFVYDLADPTRPRFKQALPAGKAPEGGFAIPARNLFAVATEEDNRSIAIRAGITLYSYGKQKPNYPTVMSANRDNGSAIPWGALSGLVADPDKANIIYSVEDSFYASNRIFTLDVSHKPAAIIGETKIMDTNNVFANSAVDTYLDNFTPTELAVMINADKSVNIDPEGIAKAADGGFWIASEGSGAAADAKSINLIFKTDSNGLIQSVIPLPESVNKLQTNNGYEGIAEYNNTVYVAFQRAWATETQPRIGMYDLATQTWKFVYYPLDTYASPFAGGWVGVSEITSLGNGDFMILERDNRGGLDAVTKRLYKINLNNVSEGQVVTKTLIRDILPDLAATKGNLLEKVEGAALTLNGDVIIVTDNDGVNDHTGETQLINLGKIFQ